MGAADIWMQGMGISGMVFALFLVIFLLTAKYSSIDWISWKVTGLFLLTPLAIGAGATWTDVLCRTSYVGTFEHYLPVIIAIVAVLICWLVLVYRWNVLYKQYMK